MTIQSIASQLSQTPMALPLLAQFSMIMNHTLDFSDSRKIEFVIGMGYRSNQSSQTILIIDIWNTVGYNCNTCTITMGINVCGILDVMTSVMNIVIKIAILLSALVVFTVVLDEINSNLDKINESEYGYNIHSDVSKNNPPTRVTPLILHKLFVIIVFIFLIMQAMDKSSLDVVLLEFDLTPQLVLNLFIQASVGTAYCNREMICNVCVVF